MMGVMKRAMGKGEGGGGGRGRGREGGMGRANVKAMNGYNEVKR
jgi:hypothetical protein